MHTPNLCLLSSDYVLIGLGLRKQGFTEKLQGRSRFERGPFLHVHFSHSCKRLSVGGLPLATTRHGGHDGAPERRYCGHGASSTDTKRQAEGRGWSVYII